MLRSTALVAGVACAACSANAQFNIYFNNFDTDNGGWTSTGTGGFNGDWEHTTSYDPANYVGAFVPPASANSGTGMWGTLINDDHTNSGEFSILSQTFDFSGAIDAQMSFASWSNLFGDFDYGEVIVNGDVLASTVSSPAPGVQQLTNDTGTAGAAWVVENIDLSAYDGLASVEVQFSMFATTVVNRAGWYIDDVRITAVPAPGAAAVLGLGGLMAFRRRR